MDAASTDGDERRLDAHEDRSEVAEHAVASPFSVFDPIADFTKPIPERTRTHVVDRNAQVTDEPLHLKRIQRNHMDQGAVASQQSVPDLIERIAVTQD